MDKACVIIVNVKTVFSILILQMVLDPVLDFTSDNGGVIPAKDECDDNSLHSAYIDMYSHRTARGSGWKRERDRKWRRQ